jgi:hypothetical protein
MAKKQGAKRRLTPEEALILTNADRAIAKAIRIPKPAARRTLASRLYLALTENLPRRASS